MSIETMQLKTIPFDVHIPNLDGDGIAETIRIEVQAYTDPESGEDILTPESLDLIEKTQNRHMGLMSAREIKELRERLDLLQEEMSDLLQIGAKTYTRWESGRARPSRSMNLMLCALRDGKLDLNYLKSLRDPATATEWVNHWAHSCCYYFSHYIHNRQPELEINFGKGCKHGLTKSMAVWRHIWPAAFELPDLDTQKQVVAWCDNEARMRNRGDNETTAPEAPKLPTSRDQRKAFLKTRYDFPRFDESVVG